MSVITPPTTEAQLMQRALAIAGFTIGEVASSLNMPMPQDLRRIKGWFGQLLELKLGASAGHLAEPDFQAIGVELKTLPMTGNHTPKETTYVTTVPLMNYTAGCWEASEVRRKLTRVLWFPYQGDNAVPLAQRLLGKPILWSPSAQQEAILRTDWQELMDMVTMGELEKITARIGHYLQIRPKAANGKSLTYGINAEGEKILTLPRGFYLRTILTKEILRDNA